MTARPQDQIELDPNDLVLPTVAEVHSITG